MARSTFSLGQRQQHVALAFDGPVEALVFGKIRFQHRRVLAQHRFAFGIESFALGEPGRDFRVLPGGGKHRQVEAHLHHGHVAELRAALQVSQFQRPVRLLVSPGFGHLRIQHAPPGIEYRQFRVTVQCVVERVAVDRPVGRSTAQGRLRTRARPSV